MGVKILGRTLSTTETELTHEPSGTKVRTVAPRDNGGDGSMFSPTDLCVASLGACALTIMKMYAARANIPVEEITFEALKEMAPTPPRKIHKITIVYKLKTTCSEDEFQKIVRAGQQCPVRLTLGDNVILNEKYERV